jgi:hypothetical protein
MWQLQSLATLRASTACKGITLPLPLLLMGRIYFIGVEMVSGGVFINMKRSHINRFRLSEVVRGDTHTDMQTQHRQLGHLINLILFIMKYG